jgi:hypothetical protein
MPRKWKQSLGLCLAVWFVLAAGVRAQTAETGQTQLPVTVVTASIAGEQARFTAPAGVAEMRIEVFTAAGEKVFDSDFKPGNLIDWPFHDQQGQRLTDGSYRCVITTKDLSGRLAQKRGEVRVQAGAATFEEAGDQTTQESGSSNAVSREAFLAILRDGLTRATAVLAHDGEKGRLVSGSGGLSFRAGDFFAGKDVERMRLTPEGNLGIGLSNPQARLDVAGMIRTSEGIVFPDGTIQTTAANASGRSGSDLDNRKATGGLENAAPSALNISGAGTTNRVTKWLDGPAGVVGDSAITEVGAKVGIGTSSPTSRLHVVGAGNQGIAIQNSEPGGRQWVLQSSVRASGGQFDIIDMTGGMYGLSILSNGNAGIGTANPQDKLHVSGGGLRLDNNRGLFLSDAAGAAKRALLVDPSNVLHVGSGGPLGVNRIDFDTAGAGNVMTINGGSVGIGTTTPDTTTKLNAVANGPVSNAISGISSATNGRGVVGSANSGTQAIGVFGVSTGGFGVQGNSASGIGVYGQSNSSHAVLGFTAGGRGVAGVYGQSFGVDGSGVIGEASGGGGAYGVLGKSPSGIGVFGDSNAGVGVYAYSRGQAHLGAALQAHNTNDDRGMAAYLSNMSKYATAHFRNIDSGEVLYLQANGGPFIKAVNNAENKTVFSVNYDGTTVTNVLQILGGADFAEQFEVNEAPEAGSSPQIQPGLVVAIDPNNPGKLVVSSHAYDRRVAGIISGAGGVKPGMMMSQAGSIADGNHPVALSGRVYCWADASNGPIEPGDLLTSSNLPGYAMKVTDHAKAQGAIIGKAMTGLKQGKGLVLVLVTLQ